MLSPKHRSAIFGVILTCLVPTAGATDVDTTYFQGLWKINAACDDDNGEYMFLRDNGTLEYGRRGTAEAVGFWATENSVLDMEMLAAPASFQDIETALVNFTKRDIYTMQVLPVQHEEDSFEAVAGIGDKMGMTNWKRCK